MPGPSSYTKALQPRARPPPHRVIFTVTDLTKEINGVRSLVMWDQRHQRRQAARGRARARSPRTTTGTSGTWASIPSEFDERGQVRGRAGHLARRSGPRGGRSDDAGGTPRKERPSTARGSRLQIGFGDIAKVFKTGQKNCVPTGCYEDVLVTDETNPDEPQDGHQLKYYAPDVGQHPGRPRRGRQGERGAGARRRSSASGRPSTAKVREEALELDKRAYDAREAVGPHAAGGADRSKPASRPRPG